MVFARSSLTRLRISLLLALLLVASAASAQSPAPSFTKVFSPNAIGPGGVSTLTFTIANSSSTVATSLAFTDNLPAGVTVASPANASFFGCTGRATPTLSAPAGGSTISFSGGAVAANGGVCTITVDVTSTTPGTHTNTSGNLTSSLGNSGSATDDLVVSADRPQFSKSFSPSSVSLGGRSTLTFLIDNSGNSNTAIELAFTDTLPSGMVVANPANVSNSCTAGSFTGGVVTAAPGSDFASLSLGGGLNVGAVAASGSCAVSVDVLGNSVGGLVNTSGELTSRPQTGGGTRSSGTASAVLDVAAVTTLALEKSFTDDPVAPGGTVNLRFTLRNLDRDFAASGIAFSDDLNAVVSGLAATGTPFSACGGSVSGTSTISFGGGSLPAGGSCSFDFSLQVPSSAATGSFNNTSSTVSGTVNGSPVSGAAASDQLFVSPIPLFTKEFTNDPVGTGGTADLEFSITNTSSSSAATDIEFIDELTTFLGFPVTATLPSSPCGAGSTIALISFGTERQGLSLTGGNLAASANCTFAVALNVPTGLADGTFVNTTTAITATVGGAPVTGGPASDTLEVIAGPALLKEFTDDPVDPGDTVTLQFTLSHPESAAGDATGIAFSDNLTAALSGLVATGLPLSNVCGAGSQISGTGNLSFAGGSLSPGDSCSFSVILQVPSTASPGPHANTTSNVTSTVAGVSVIGNTASDDLAVAGITLTKEFIDDPVLPGGTVTLRFTIANVTASTAATDIAFEDDLDASLENLAATGLPLSNVCGTGSSLVGSAFLTFFGGTLAAGASCSFDVTLQVPAGAAPDTYPNATEDFSATVGGSTVSFENARDDLVVGVDVITLTKEFTDDPVIPGGTANLRFILSNLDPSQAVSGLQFSDNLTATLPGLAATGLPFSACGGNVSGTTTISFSGGSLAGGASCSFDVAVSVPAVSLGSSFFNTTSAVTGSIGGLTVTGEPGTDTLRIAFLTFSKSFDGPAPAGGSAVLTFDIQNVSSTITAARLGFRDDLAAVLPGLAAATPLPSNPCGGGSTLTAAPVLTLSNGTLLPGASCTFSVTVDIPSNTAPGSYLNVTGALRQDGQRAANPATATLVVLEANQPPTVDTPVVTPEPSDEGSAVAVTAGFSDSDGAGDAPFSCSVDFGDGSAAVAGVVAGFACSAGPHTYADDGGYPVEVSVTDKDGDTGSASTLHFVDNVAPTIDDTFNSAAECGDTPEGGTVEVSVDFSDPGFDAFGRFEDFDNSTIDWGDGTVESAVVVDTPGSAGVATTGTASGSHVYATGGVFTITVTVEDDDGDSASVELTALVTGVRLTDSGELQVVGTPFDDVVKIELKDDDSDSDSDDSATFFGAAAEILRHPVQIFSGGRSTPRVAMKASTGVVRVKLTTGAGGDDDSDDGGDSDSGSDSEAASDSNSGSDSGGGDDEEDSDAGGGFLEFPLADVASIWVQTCAGDDHIQVDDDLTVPAVLDGGSGNDDIRAGDGLTFLIGGPGADKLRGGDAGDVLEGRDGPDDMWGNDGDDTLLGGADDDKLFGRRGDDKLFGEEGNDTLHGNDGDDELDGGPGVDKCRPGKGSDTVTACEQ